MARPMTDPAVAAVDGQPAPGSRPEAGRRARSARRPRGSWVGWLFAAPAIIVYAIFVLRPMALTVQYSFYKWDGIGAVEMGRAGGNYRRLFTDPETVRLDPATRSS